jgi:hypothetical protein
LHASDLLSARELESINLRSDINIVICLILAIRCCRSSCNRTCTCTKTALYFNCFTTFTLLVNCSEA